MFNIKDVSSIMERKAIKAVVLIVKQCLSNYIHVERPSFAPHLHASFHERSFCCIGKDWKVSIALLFCGLWGLASFVHQCGLLGDNHQTFTGEVTYIKAQIVCKLHVICSITSSVLQ